MKPKTMPLVKKAWSTMSCGEGRSCGLGLRICCTSLHASRDTSLCDGNSYWLSRMRLHGIHVKFVDESYNNETLLIYIFDVLRLERRLTDDKGIEDDTD